MLKNKKTIFFILIIMILCICSIQTTCFAKNINTETFKPTSDPLDPTTKKLAGIVVGAITNVGSVVAIMALIIIGIRFVLGSVEEKAQYKESMKPYLIGAFLLFGILRIVDILYEIGTGLV